MKLIIDIPEEDYRYIKELQSLVIARGTCKTIQREVINAIKNGTPYEERPKGKWVKKPHVYGVDYCSECDFELKIDDTNFCPNCGAEMRGEEK